MEKDDITYRIIKIFYKVYNSLGYGFLEKVYENAMKIEFRESGLDFVNQKPIKVFYKNEIIGEYVADFLIEGKVIVEIKATRGISQKDSAQLLNYLTSTDIELGLLLNYGEKPEIKRRVYSNNIKKYNDRY